MKKLAIATVLGGAFALSALAFTPLAMAQQSWTYGENSCSEPKVVGHGSNYKTIEFRCKVGSHDPANGGDGNIIGDEFPADFGSVFTQQRMSQRWLAAPSNACNGAVKLELHFAPDKLTVSGHAEAAGGRNCGGEKQFIV